MIYVVEDDDAVRESLALLLTIRGHQVVPCAAGEELPDFRELEDADCLILDVNLPGKSGLSILAELRDRSFRTPVILISGEVGRAARKEAERLGAISFLEKPVPWSALAAALEDAQQSKETDRFSK